MQPHYAGIACKLGLILDRVMLDVESSNLVGFVAVDKPVAMLVSQMQHGAMIACKSAHFRLGSTD